MNWTCQNVSLAWLAGFGTKDQIGQNLSISAKLILSLQMEQRDLFRQSLHGKGYTQEEFSKSSGQLPIPNSHSHLSIELGSIFDKFFNFKGYK